MLDYQLKSSAKDVLTAKPGDLVLFKPDMYSHPSFKRTASEAIAGKIVPKIAIYLDHGASDSYGRLYLRLLVERKAVWLRAYPSEVKFIGKKQKQK